MPWVRSGQVSIPKVPAIKELFIYHFREKPNKDTEIINKFEENLS